MTHGSTPSAAAATTTSMSQKIAELLSPLLSKAQAPALKTVDEGAEHTHEHGAQPPSTHHAPSSAHAHCDAGATPAAPMVVFPELTALVRAARACALPPARRSPEAWTPDYPSTMLALSNTAPPAMARQRWCLADYHLVAKLYKGYASNVYKATCKRSNQVVVLKVYTLSAVCDLYKYQIFRELSLHSSLQHEHIIAMHAAWHEGDHVVMVQEYADGADLFSVMQRYGGRMSERLTVQLVLEPFLKVLTHLHARGIIHRDIKPENILFTKDMVLKLADFGLAIDLGAERAVTRAGTLDYMAPEVLQCPFKSHPEENKDKDRLHYSMGVDSWAVGVLTFELLVGVPPFYDPQHKSTETRIKASAPTIPAGLSEQSRDFILGALNKAPSRRLQIHQMLHHGWIEGFRAARSARMGPHASVAGAVALPARANVAAATAAAAPAAKSPLGTRAAVRAPLMYAVPAPAPAPLRTPMAAAAGAPASETAAERLLQGSHSLQEYLQQQQQQRRAAEQKRAAACQPSKPRVDIASLAARADGAVIVGTTADSPLGPKGGARPFMMTSAQSLNMRGL